MKKYLLYVFLLNFFYGTAQNYDSVFISKISNEALKSKEVLNNLKYLCDSTPGRLLGSPDSYKALRFLKSRLLELSSDTCFFQNYETTAWKHYSTKLTAKLGRKSIIFHALALGPSVSTSGNGMETGIIEVHSFEELDKLGRKNVEGKIVFYNREMNNLFINPSQAYGDLVRYRTIGAIQAARYGAVGAIIRSLSTAKDTSAHTGKMIYSDTIPKIPFIAISALDADQLSNLITINPYVKIHLNVKTKVIENITTSNLIADFKGTEYPDQYILIGAHVDSWYNTPGAHDDGSGCVQMLEIARIFHSLNYKPRYTLRIVYFMDEELFQTGGNVYAEYSKLTKINHYIALESDGGGMGPNAIAIAASDTITSRISRFADFLKPYGFNSFIKGHTDVDIGPLQTLNVPLIGNRPQNQRYFDYHHSGIDTFDKVNFRELQLSTVIMAGLIYLIDQHGIH